MVILQINFLLVKNSNQKFEKKFGLPLVLSKSNKYVRMLSSNNSKWMGYLFEKVILIKVKNNSFINIIQLIRPEMNDTSLSSEKIQHIYQSFFDNSNKTQICVINDVI